MIKIGFTGLPGSGKTTIVRSLAADLSKNNFVETVDEYARVYISRFDSSPSVSEQYLVTEKQMEKEELVKADILLTDSPVFLGFYYANDMATRSEKDIYYVSELFKKIQKWHSNNPYDIVFHLEPNIQPKEDGVRPSHQFDSEWRENANIAIKAYPIIFKAKNFFVIENLDIKRTIEFCKIKIDEEISRKKIKREENE